MGSSTAPNPAAIAKEIVPVQGCNSSSMWLPSHTSPEKSTQQLRQDPAAKVQQSPGQSSTAKHPANKVEVLAPLPPTRPFLLPVKILRPDTTGCIPADPEYKNKRRRRKRNEGSVMLGGVQIKGHCRHSTTQCGRQSWLLDRKLTTASAAEGAAEITLTTQRMAPVPRVKKQRNH